MCRAGRGRPASRDFLPDRPGPRRAQDLEHAHAVPWIHGCGRIVLHPCAHSLVEGRVVAGVEAFDLAEAGIAGAHAVAQLRLLRVEAVAGEAGLQPAHSEARPVQRRDRAHPQVRDLTALVRQRYEGVVVDCGVRTAGADLRVHLRGRPEELNGLVHEVRSEVQQHAAALGCIAALAPAFLDLWPEALEARLEARYLTELTAAYEPLDGQEVTVPAAVVGDRDAGAAGLRDPAGVGSGDRHRLVDDHVQPALDP